MNWIGKLAVLFILVGIIYLAGPTFGFTTLSADRVAEIDVAEDPGGLVGIVDNSPTEKIDGEDSEEDAVTVYDLYDQTGSFDAEDFDAEVALIENEDGDNVLTEPPLTAEVEAVTDNEFELVVYCSGELGIQNDDYLVTVDVEATGDFTLEFERETNNLISINCAGAQEDQPPFFTVDIVGTNLPINEGETLTVDAEIENVGDEDGTQEVVLRNDDGAEVDSREVTLTSGESTVIEDLQWELESGNGGENMVTVESEDDEDSITFTVGDAESVYVVADESFGNNDDIETPFDVDTSEETYQFEVRLNEAGGGGNQQGTAGNGWDTKEVIIEGKSFTVTGEAADDITIDLNSRDLLSEGTYEDLDAEQEEQLAEISTTLDTESEITNLEQDTIELEIEIR